MTLCLISGHMPGYRACTVYTSWSARPAGSNNPLANFALPWVAGTLSEWFQHFSVRPLSSVLPLVTSCCVLFHRYIDHVVTAQWRAAVVAVLWTINIKAFACFGCIIVLVLSLMRSISLKQVFGVKKLVGHQWGVRNLNYLLVMVPTFFMPFGITLNARVTPGCTAPW